MIYILTAEPANYLDIADLRALFPNTSWGSDPDAAFLETMGLAKVVQTSAPTPSSAVKAVYRTAPTFAGGVWTEQWAERNKTASELVSAINKEKTARLDEGAPYDGKRYQVDAESLANIGGMLHAASLALQNMMEWGAPYNQRIAVDNTVTTFATPLAAIAFAAAVGAWYGSTVLYARTLKDAALEGGTPDYTTGWP